MRYRTTLRPASSSTLPSGLKWDFVEAPTRYTINRPDLPRSTHPFGVFTTERALTKEEMHHFDIVEVL